MSLTSILLVSIWGYEVSTNLETSPIIGPPTFNDIHFNPQLDLPLTPKFPVIVFPEYPVENIPSLPLIPLF